jgi:uncharacterized membrane protein
MAIVDILPMRWLFVAVFGLFPIVMTIYTRGPDNISMLEWVSFGIIAIGSLLVFVVSDMNTSVEMQRLLWPLLALMGAGMLVYRIVLTRRGEFDESEIERGGTSYE